MTNKIYQQNFIAFFPKNCTICVSCRPVPTKLISAQGGLPMYTTQPVVYQPAVVVGAHMGPKPSPVTCPSCRHQIVTRVELKSSTKTHLFAVLLCLVFFPCVCLPYCLDSCHNADHYCPNCNAYIGSYNN